jgi:hypothetical protein
MAAYGSSSIRRSRSQAGRLATVTDVGRDAVDVGSAVSEEGGHADLPGTSLPPSAFTMIRKRVVNREDIDVFSMFATSCHAIEQIRAPKRSFFGRLFGPRLT